ncbi:glycosyltransferase family 2 protein [Ancylomarina euxinus]|uniref:Glycosyltransferase family 2 protein n=1 Tax=Ancylomarina euxinus TaxID=2283627 RepID=A0A425Y0F5_9BACT|nr:glycosyltransferase family A protein [Ancylomarina euxinus]MCZ4695249.1 glycosyltransferase family A protein [Ancylomarina euxinus]MUP15446.1 glycosyltransferase [Ancylomarina euxinus]RRG21156.1 glycosyltransferase family 2 protein [Ancylomarina euxinus]
MNYTINCFLPVGTQEETQSTIKELQSSNLVTKIFLIGDSDFELDGAELLSSKSLLSGQTIHEIGEKSISDFTLIYTKTSALKLGQFALNRFVKVATDTQASLTYSDSKVIKKGQVENHPVIDYQEGSLRDDFDFGSLLFINTKALKKASVGVDKAVQYAGLYSLRLALSEQSELLRIPEYLYTDEELDTRKSGEKIFDYVDPKNRVVQIEMEKVCTEYLKRAGGYLEPKFAELDFNSEQFHLEASVIIPVLNRVKTLEDAIKSVLCQKSDFAFNLIIVDNHSTDGTTDLIQKYAEQDDRIIHLIPKRKDLGIGGCWNEAAHHKNCGRFAIQLDSDDLYADETTIQQIIESFHKEKCAMVVGSYQMVNFKLEEIPPGLIDHKEWTPENGRNNAIRINGLGAPRAFYTPILRETPLPNVNYGEDYALGLAISRKHQIGRIYNSLYLCRRWDENSDASLSIEKMNAHNSYKDRIRTIELKARRIQNL